MVRAVSVDDGLLERHSQLQRTKAFESGLLLAQVGSKGDTLLRLVPTPEQDDCKASTVDADWMLEHAVQVSRMLPGGVVVMGCYVFAPTAKFVPYESRLQAVLGAIAKRLPQSMSEPQSVLLLLPTDSKKPSCRACSAATARLQPIELKTTPVPPQLVCFSCDWAIDLTLALQPSPSSTHASQLSAQLGALEATLAASFETIDGQRPFSGHTVAQLSRAVGTTVQPHRVEFFSPVPMAPAPVKGARALVRVVGVVHGRAFALLKADVAAVIDDLRRDLIQSLRARVPLLLDQLAEEDEETDNEDGGMADKQNFDLDKEASYALPRRVHIDVGDGLSLCDFLGSEVRRYSPRSSARCLHLSIRCAFFLLMHASSPARPRVSSPSVCLCRRSHRTWPSALVRYSARILRTRTATSRRSSSGLRVQRSSPTSLLTHDLDVPAKYHRAHQQHVQRVVPRTQMRGLVAERAQRL